MAEHLDPASFAWGLALGVTFGSWLRGALDALLLRPRRLSISNGNCEPLPPPRLAPGMRRVCFDSPQQMAECGGPCWEAQDPRCRNCGALWRDVPINEPFPR